MACCASRPARRAATNTHPPAGSGAKQLSVRPPQQRPLAGPRPPICDGGSAEDSGSEADSFYSADDVFRWSGAVGSEQEAAAAEAGGKSSDAPGGDVARVQALLSSMSPDSVAAQGWERAASWSSDAGTACAYRKPAADETGVFVFFFEGTQG